MGPLNISGFLNTEGKRTYVMSQEDHSPQVPDVDGVYVERYNGGSLNSDVDLDLEE